MVTVAVDAMGGDSAPADPVIGAFGAVRANPQLKIKLVGIKDILEKYPVIKSSLEEIIKKRVLDRRKAKQNLFSAFT